jgi:hypothetical protein
MFDIKKTDRTKHLYCEALLALCEDKQLSKITVSELARKTGTVRQTFYNNFYDINDLVSYIPINFLESTDENYLSPESARRVYEFALDHQGFFRQLPAHSGQNSFRETFITWLKEAYYAKHINEEMDDDEKLRRKLGIDFFAIAITNQFLDWCSTGFAWPLDILLKVQEAALPDFARL